LKTLTSLFTSLVISTSIFAQGGSIISFYTLPASPTTNDAVKVVAELMFTSGSCELSEQGHTTTLSRTDAYAHHCVGMLTVICPATDTFNLGTLPAGDHTFVLTLTSGGAPSPCTPGIVTDDTDSITFTVDPGVGIYSPDAVDFSVYPNPASTFVTLSLASGEKGLKQNTKAIIYNAQGALVLTTPNIINQTLNIENLSPGLYYLHLQSAEGTAVKKFEVYH
jgi:hypothetical protein